MKLAKKEKVELIHRAVESRGKFFIRARQTAVTGREMFISKGIHETRRDRVISNLTERLCHEYLALSCRLGAGRFLTSERYTITRNFSFLGAAILGITRISSLSAI